MENKVLEGQLAYSFMLVLKADLLYSNAVPLSPVAPDRIGTAIATGVPHYYIY